MTSDSRSWFAIGVPGGTSLVCGACGQEADLGFPSVDHHSAFCPACGVESLYLTWGGTLVQVVLDAAPAEVVRAVRWAQANLDELEFVTLLVSVAEIQSALLQETSSS